jgi:hypothetical protein
MRFRLKFTDEAARQLHALEEDASQSKRLKAVRKTLGLMQTNLRHPGLQTHKYDSIVGPKGAQVFEAYSENKTPGAYRVFWHYGPGKGVITIVTITVHP